MYGILGRPSLAWAPAYRQAGCARGPMLARPYSRPSTLIIALSKNPDRLCRQSGFFGRGGRNRTHDKGFGDLCDTTSPRPHNQMKNDRCTTIIRRPHGNTRANISAFGSVVYLSSSASISIRRLYFATRSPLLGAPALIKSAFTATARSAMVVSVVSPERCEMITVMWCFCAS